MRYLISLLLLSLSLSGFAQKTPEETLEKYFKILTTQNTAGVADLMDSRSMANLKKTMDEAIKFQANHGLYDLQRRIFGEKVPMSQVEAATARFYLEQLAGEIVNAAQVQHLVVADRTILGRVDESETQVHFVVRLHMTQQGKTGQDIIVYSLVKEGKNWKLMFPPTIRQMITVIDAQARRIR